MSKTIFNRVTMKADSHGEVMIYDTIGEDWWTGEGVTAKSFDSALKSIGPVSTLDVRINSGGGDVFHGNAIYSQLVAHPAKKMVYIDGIAASMASIIAMAGDEIHMAANALFMIHEPSGVAVGTAEEMLATAALLEQISSNAVDVYTARTGQEKATVKAAMLAETWFTAEQAKEAGYVTSITPNKQLTAQVDPGVFAKAPDWAKDRLKLFAESQLTKEAPMPDPVIEPAPPAAPTAPEAVATPDAAQLAIDRCAEITAKCQTAGVPQMATDFMRSSMSVGEVSAKLLDIVCQKNAPIGDGGASPPESQPSDPVAKFKQEWNASPDQQKNMSIEDYISLRMFQEGLEPLIPPTKK